MLIPTHLKFCNSMLTKVVPTDVPACRHYNFDPCCSTCCPEPPQSKRRRRNKGTGLCGPRTAACTLIGWHAHAHMQMHTHTHTTTHTHIHTYTHKCSRQQLCPCTATTYEKVTKAEGHAMEWILPCSWVMAFSSSRSLCVSACTRACMCVYVSVCVCMIVFVFECLRFVLSTLYTSQSC